MYLRAEFLRQIEQAHVKREQDLKYRRGVGLLAQIMCLGRVLDETLPVATRYAMWREHKHLVNVVKEMIGSKSSSAIRTLKDIANAYPRTDEEHNQVLFYGCNLVEDYWHGEQLCSGMK